MSSDLILRDDADVRYSYDNIKTQGYLNGHLTGLETAAAWLRQQAILLFNAGKDKEAVWLRDLAAKMVAEIEPQLEKIASDHETKFPEMIEKE